MPGINGTIVRVCAHTQRLRFVAELSDDLRGPGAGHISRPLPPVEIFDFYHRQTRNMIDKAPQPAGPHLRK
jgi:hypothetical protein